MSKILNIVRNMDKEQDRKQVTMIDKQMIKPRPICLYEDTCLHLKEKTRLCEDCIHHKNYWSELLEKEQVEKIKSLEQEYNELMEKIRK